MVTAVATGEPARIQRHFDDQAHAAGLRLREGRQDFLVERIEEDLRSLAFGRIQYSFELDLPVEGNAVLADLPLGLELFQLLV